MDQYAVMGNPVEHSKSPIIHTLFAALTQQALEYTKIHVELDGFEEAVRAFFGSGGKGLNITVPFKQEAWELAQKHSDDAVLAGAINTLFLDEAGILQGHNTDGIGLVRDVIQNKGGSLENKSILILGAGGAGRGILNPLLREEPSNICIANRTVSKAHQLANDFASYGNVKGCGFDELEGQQFDWVFNASSASLQGQLPPLPDALLKAGACCYDLMYSVTETIFCRWGKEHGAEKTIDGLGMLVEQAAESFYLWRGVRPDTGELIKQQLNFF